jgi:hypothetical protein
MPGAGIADRDLDEVGRVGGFLVRRAALHGFLEAEQAGRDHRLAALRHGVAGIEQQVEQRSLELAGIEPRRRQPLRQVEAQPQPRPEAARQQLRHAAQRGVHIGRLSIQPLPPGEGEKLARQHRAPPRRFQRALVAAPGAGVVALLDQRAQHL